MAMRLGVFACFVHRTPLKHGSPLRIFDDQFRLEDPGFVLSLLRLALAVDQEQGDVPLIERRRTIPSTRPADQGSAPTRACVGPQRNRPGDALDQGRRQIRRCVPADVVYASPCPPRAGSVPSVR